MMKKVLVIGTGSIAQKHINILKSLKYLVYVYSETNNEFFKKNLKINRLTNLDKLNILKFLLFLMKNY